MASFMFRNWLALTKMHLVMQFGTHGNLEQHGFARNRFWTIDNDPPPLPANPAIKAYVDLILRPSEEDLKIWPHSFEFRLRVALGPSGDLSLTSRIRNTNTDGRPFSYTFAYHTYFSVSDIRYLLDIYHFTSHFLLSIWFPLASLKLKMVICMSFNVLWLVSYYVLGLGDPFFIHVAWKPARCQCNFWIKTKQIHICVLHTWYGCFS